MTNLNCEYCNSVFKSFSALKLHQKKAKYCIKIQKDNKDYTEEIINIQFKCENCGKVLSSKRNLDNHYSICNNVEKLKDNILKYKLHISKLINQEEEYKSTIIKQEEKIKELENTIEKLAINAINKPTTTNNTTNTLNIMSPLDFTNINKIKDLIDDNYNINYAIDGQKGLARFVVY